MERIFSGCSSLTKLPDLSKWNTHNVTNTNSMLSGCSSLITLPDISKWNMNKNTDVSEMFFNCSSLKYLPDISKWNTQNVVGAKGFLAGCSSLKEIPDLSTWTTVDKSEIFIPLSHSHNDKDTTTGIVHSYEKNYNYFDLYEYNSPTDKNQFYNCEIYQNLNLIK